MSDSIPGSGPDLSAAQKQSLLPGPENLGNGTDIPFVGYIGGAFVVGMSIGYFSKKAIKLTLFLFGMLIVGYLLLLYNQMVPEVDSTILTEGASSATGHVNNFGAFVFDWLSKVDGKNVGGVGVGATAGFFVGWKMA